MIVAVCLNPAIDVTYRTSSVRAASSHTVDLVAERAGGKGVNVARVLHQMGERVVLTGLLGGESGDAIRGELATARLTTSFSRIAAPARRSVTVVAEDDATVFNERGPTVTEAEWQRFVAGFIVLVAAADVVTISGSAPPGLPVSCYATLVRAAGAAGIPVVLDAYGETFLAALPERPTVVAPNRREAMDALGRSDGDLDDFAVAELLRAEGAQSVVLSRGADGVAAVSDTGCWAARPPSSMPGNPTGAGDALTAALAYALCHGLPWPDALVTAISWSSGAVAVPWAGQVDEAVVANVRDRATAEEISWR